MTHAIDRRDVNSVSDGVTALNGLPSIALRRAVLFFLVRMPADGRRIKQNVCASKRRQPRAFRVPLIPADQSSDLPYADIERAKAEVARREVKLFVISRIIRYVHLAIDASRLAFAVNDDCAVVIKPCGAALEYRSDDGDVMFARDARERLSRRAIGRFRKIEEVCIFFLAEVLRAKQLRQTDDLSALLAQLLRL